MSQERQQSIGANCQYGAAYEPLDGRSTRLLRLHHGQTTQDDRLLIELIAVPFDELDQHDYEALSYHWGGAEASFSVYQATTQHDIPEDTAAQWKHQQILVRPNLHAALSRLRSQYQSTLLWVDALCINQEDASERSHQVEHMALIFSTARKVLVWLGEGDKRTENAFRFIRDKVSDIRLVDSLISSKEPQVIRGWEDIMHLMQAEWFYRRWIVQELALARSAIVLCGSQSLQLSDLSNALDTISSEFDTIRLGFSDNRYRPRSGWAEHTKPPSAATLIGTVSNIFKTGRSISGYAREPTQSLEYLVCEFAWSQASDPRDTATAFMSIAKETYHRSMAEQANDATINRDKEALLKTDYNKDALRSYVDFVQWIQRRSGDLDIILRRWAIPEVEDDRPFYPARRVLPSWIRTAIEIQDNIYLYRDRAQANSFVGLPGHGKYAACGDQKATSVTYNLLGTSSSVHREWNKVKAATVHTKDRPVLYQLRSQQIDASMEVQGILVGPITWTSSPMASGTLGNDSLQRLLTAPDGSFVNSEGTFDKMAQCLLAERSSDGTTLPPRYSQACEYILSSRKGARGIATRALLAEEGHPRAVRAYLERMQSVIWNRRFIEVTTPDDSDGLHERMGTAAKANLLHGFARETVKQGDIVCVLFGCSVPVILRQCFDEREGYYFISLGGAYVYGIMDGQAIPRKENDLKNATRTFRIF